MSHFTVSNLPLTGLKLIERQRAFDDRGYFSRLFCADKLSTFGRNKPIAQINHTYTTRRGTVRGIHYQTPPYAEIKMVTCIRGKVWDLAVDLRAQSPTFLRWQAQILSAENAHALLIPEGFAHGFQTLVDDCELLYLHSEAYAPQAEAALRFDDPRLNITWPLPISEMSVRDRAHPLLTAKFNGIEL